MKGKWPLVQRRPLAHTVGVKPSYSRNRSAVQGSLRVGIARSAALRILPDVILTLVHSTRLLPLIVKIMSVPRSVSRAIPALRSPSTESAPQSAERPRCHIIDWHAHVGSHASRVSAALWPEASPRQSRRPCRTLRASSHRRTRNRLSPDTNRHEPFQRLAPRHSVPNDPYVPNVPLYWHARPRNAPAGCQREPATCRFRVFSCRGKPRFRVPSRLSRAEG